MLRTLFVLIIIAVGIRYSFRGAFYALLFYLWIAYFRPETWLWFDFVSSLNLSFLVGALVVVTTLSSKERFRLDFGSALLFLFLAQGLLATLHSPVSDQIWHYWVDFARVIVISYALVTLVTTEERLRLTLLVIAVSLGFEGAKQGWAQLILNPGAVNTNTLPSLGDNNGVAVGMLMLVPLLTTLARLSPYRLEKHAERFMLVGVLYRAISTYSRGGFLSAGALGIHYLLRSKRKVLSVIAVVVVAAVIIPALPQAFWARMDTITSATGSANDENVDSSIAGRLHFWGVAVDIANAQPLTGVGMNGFNLVYDRYDSSNGQFGSQRSVHSAWFGILAELGYTGLVIFFMLMAYAFFVCWKARRLARRRPDLANLAAYATAIEAGLVVFAIGGSFVPFQYFEILWHFLALSIVVGRIVKMRVTQTVEAPAAVPVGGMKPSLATAGWPNRGAITTTGMRSR